MITKKIAHLLVLFMAISAYAQNSVPSLITYQGKLVDASGAALPNGIYSLAFKLYDAATGGTLVWGQTYSAPVMDGVFSVALGAAGGTAVPGAAVTDIRFAFGGPNRFLQIEVLSDENEEARPEPLVLLPRQQMGSVPYANTALHGVPAGTVVPFAGPNLPEGWVLCDGGVYSSTDPRYSSLFGVLGTFYGHGGANTFRVPDLRGRTIIGSGQGSGLSNRPRGQTVGAETHTLTAAEIPPHAHGVNDPGHSHRGRWGTQAAAGNQGGTWGYGITHTWYPGGGGSPDDAIIRRETTGITIQQNTGGGGAHNNMQPSLALNYIIKL